MTKETNKQIIADAPEGATHVDEDGYNVKQTDYEDVFADSKTYFHWDEAWNLVENPSFCLLRSLADIEALVERDKKIAELEQALDSTNNELLVAIQEVNNYMSEGVNSSSQDEPDYWDFQTVHANQTLLSGNIDTIMLDKLQAKRDLQSKLEAVNHIISHDSAKCKSKKSVDCNAIHLADLHNYAFELEQQLREQAKGGDL